MGNAVISGILFQPPSPPNPLIDVKFAMTALKYANINVKYFWLYSKSGQGEYNLIPAIHITHNNNTTSTAQQQPAGSNSNNAQSAENVAQRYTLLYSHGNAEDIGLISTFLLDLAYLLQINIICYDYSGYGVSADAKYIDQFWKVYAKDIVAWKCWCGQQNQKKSQNINSLHLSRGGGQACRYSKHVFVADVVHPISTNNDNEQQVAADNTAATAKIPIPEPSEVNCYANILTVYNYLTSIENISSKHIILYGKSVGSGPTCWLGQRITQLGSEINNSHMSSYGCSNNDDCVSDNMCFITQQDADESREPIQYETRGASSSSNSNNVKNQGQGQTATIGGIVLHSPFLSVIRVVLDVGFTTIGDLFPNIDRVRDLTCPVYIIHGSNDAIVPFYHGQTLFDALPDESKTVPFWARGVGHNNIEMNMATAYVKRLQQFVRQCDRLNYPAQMSSQKQVKQQLQRQANSASHQPQGGVFRAKNNAAANTNGGRPTIMRYASQDSYHQVMTTSTSPKSRSSSKQRKQKGTLVMRSSHSAGGAVALPFSSPPTTPSQRQIVMMTNQHQQQQQQQQQWSPSHRARMQYHQQQQQQQHQHQQQYQQQYQQQQKVACMSSSTHTSRGVRQYNRSMTDTNSCFY